MQNSNNSANHSEQEQKKDYDLIKTEFIREFSAEKMRDDKEKVKYVKEVMENGKSERIKDELKKFKKINKDKYSALKIKDIDINDLKNWIWKEYVKIENTKSLFLSTIAKSYDLDEQDLGKIKIYSSDKTSEELFAYIQSPSKLELLLRCECENIIPKDTSKIFERLQLVNKENIQEKLNNMNPSDADEVLGILSRLSKYIIRERDIVWLFEFEILSYKEKKHLVEKYIPTISLMQAKELWLITEKEAEEEKQNILIKKIEDEDVLFVNTKWNISSDINNILSNNIVKGIINSIQLSDIEVETSKFISESNINNLAKEKWLSNLQIDIEGLKEKISENAKKLWPSNFDELVLSLEQLDNNSRFKNLSKFKEWNIIKLEKVTKEGKTVVSYLEFTSFDNDNKSLGLKVVWEKNRITTDTSNINQESKTYVEFLDFLSNDKTVKLDFFTKEDINEKINSWELKIAELELLEIDEFSKLSDEEKEKQTRDYILWLEDEINWLEKELESNSENEELKELLDHKKEIFEQLNGTDEGIISVVNRQKLLEKLDEIDPEGKNIVFNKWSFFISEGNVYEITAIDDINGTINLKSSLWVPENNIPFAIFLQVFKEKNSKRIKTIKSFSEIISSQLEENKKWENFEVIDWELIKKWEKDWESKGNKVVDFLVWDETDNIIRINDISWDHAHIQLGERKNFSDLSKEDKKKSGIKKNAEWEKISLSEEFVISLSELNKLIEKDKLYPNWSTWKNLPAQKPEELENKFHSKLSTRIFNRYSVSELIAWWTMFIEWFKESIKSWNDVHAAKVALAMWKILPWELEEDLRIKVERAEQEWMDKALESLGKVDSWIAVERIEWWLLNKDTAEYKKEAAILFMLDKYGHLTSKSALYKYRWKWLWYEALWWRQGDALFQDIKKQAEAGDITFTEEYLVHILLKKQCKWAKGFYPKRRSRLHKEYEAKWKNWIESEYKKWFDDAEKKRTARTMVDWGMDEAKWWTTSNAIWWFKKAVERGGSLEDMSEWFFSLLFSGCLYRIDQATFNHIKALWDGWMPIIMTGFSTTYSDMKLFNQTVVELSKKIEENYPGHAWIQKEAEQLFKDANNFTWKEEDRLTRAQEFWKKHWTPLSRALNIANKDDNTYSKTDKVIFLEKDENTVFNQYFSQMKTFTSNATFDKAYIYDACWEVWLSWLNVGVLSRIYLQIWNNRKFRDWKWGSRVWREISADLKATKDKVFDTDPLKDKEKKQRYLMQMLRELISAFFASQWWRTLEAYNDPTSDLWQTFNSWNLNIYNDLWHFSETDIVDWKADYILQKAVDRILSWATTSSDFSDPFSEVTWNTSESLDEIMWE